MSPELINLIVQATGETLFMVGIAALLGTVFGLPLGVFLATSKRGELARPLPKTIAGLLGGFTLHPGHAQPII